MQQKYYWISGIIVLFVIVIGVFVFVNSSQQNNDGKKENIVTWSEAIRNLNSGEVEQVFQTHNLDVTLILKDGTRIYTKEPGIDDIFDEVEKCEEPCKDIVIATE